MSRPDFFAGAPDPSRDFNAKADELRPPIDAANWPTHNDLDHFDLADRALTPGGELEYRVHKQVRIQRTTQWSEPSKTPSLTDEQELDFGDAFDKASGQRGREAPSTDMSPEQLRSSIEAELGKAAREFDRSAGPDRGSPDR